MISAAATAEIAGTVRHWTARFQAKCCPAQSGGALDQCVSTPVAPWRWPAECRCWSSPRPGKTAVPCLCNAFRNASRSEPGTGVRCTIRERSARTWPSRPRDRTHRGGERKRVPGILELNREGGQARVVKDYVDKLRMLSRDVRLMLVASALLGFAVWGGIYGVLLNLYLLRLGCGPRFIGLVNSTGMLTVGVFALPVGVISARVGVRRMLIASAVLSGIGFVALPFAELAPRGLCSPPLLTAYSLGYLGLTLWAVTASPFLAAATGEQERGHAFSLRQVLSTLGAFAGRFVAGLLPRLFATLLAARSRSRCPIATRSWPPVRACSRACHCSRRPLRRWHLLGRVQPASEGGSRWA